MKLPVKKLHERLDRLFAAVHAKRGAGAPTYGRYRDDPVGYAADVLKVDWWAKQQEIARLARTPPYRVLVKASHSVGKSHLAGGLVNWWYDTHDPGVCLTTAPTARQVRDVLWKEVRRQRGGRGGFPGPKIPRLESSPMHFAYGFTAGNATAFQGQHEAAVMILLDEAVGVHREIWEGADSMTQGVEYCIIAFANPTDTASEFYGREQAGGWHVVHIPCFEHPNIAAELAGLPAPYPSAVRLAWLQERLDEWADPIAPGDEQATDIEWPPGSGAYLRPGPLAEARLLGRWPSASSGVWSDAVWALAERGLPLPDAGVLPEVGCDVARFGDDNTEFHVRCGPVSLHHEAHNGWDNAQVIGRLRQLCGEWAEWATKRRPPQVAPVKPEAIRCKVDDDGMGGRVVDHAAGYDWVAVRAGNSATRPDQYPNLRSELWFNAAEAAKIGRLDLTRLSPRTRRELKRQAMAPRYKLDAPGRRVVEPKAVTKAELGRSPDGLDALNLAYFAVGGDAGPKVVGGGERAPRQNYRDRNRG